MTKHEREIYLRAILLALQYASQHNARTVFDDIVRATDAKDLVKLARKYRAMRSSGLSRYGYGRKGKS